MRVKNVSCSDDKSMRERVEPRLVSVHIHVQIKYKDFIIWQVMKYREICMKYNQYLKKLYFHM